MKITKLNKLSKLDRGTKKLFQDLLEEAESIESVVVIIEKKDGSARVDWDFQGTEEICLKLKVLDVEVNNLFRRT